MTRAKTLVGCLALALAVAGPPAGESARAASWHLDPSFGKRGVAGLPVREGAPLLVSPGPGDAGSLLAPGPQGSVFVGGYAHSRKGSFLVARLSAQGGLVKSFGRGGVSTIPAIYSVPQAPPRMFALSGGRLLIAGLDRADHFVLVRLTGSGRPDRSFGHDGVADYKLRDSHGHAIIAAVALEPDGDILAVTYQREAPQPVNQPRIPPGLGQGPIEFVRLLPSGALDHSFGQGGFLKATGQPAVSGEEWAVGVTITPEGSVLFAYQQVPVPNTGLAQEPPAVQEFSPTGATASGFGNQGVAYLPFTPTFQGESSAIFDGLFALPGGGFEVSFGGGGQLFGFTATGAPNTAFGTAGHTAAGPGVLDLAVAADGETFALQNSTRLTVGGTLSSGAPDPGLGGRNGISFPVSLPRHRLGEEEQANALLAGDDTVTILFAEELVRISR
jgi:hypothetical protein